MMSDYTLLGLRVHHSGRPFICLGLDAGGFLQVNPEQLKALVPANEPQAVIILKSITKPIEGVAE